MSKVAMPRIPGFFLSSRSGSLDVLQRGKRPRPGRRGGDSVEELNKKGLGFRKYKECRKFSLGQFPIQIGIGIIMLTKDNFY